MANPDASHNFWTPRVILGIFCVLVIAIASLGSAGFLIYCRHLRNRARNARLQDDTQTPLADDIEDKGDAQDGCQPGNTDSSLHAQPRFTGSASRSWSVFSGRKAPEPELPWPVLAVLPKLRPKQPIHRRILNLLLSWRREEVKREPFTVADVLRAIEESNANVQGSNAYPADATETINYSTVAVYSHQPNDRSTSLMPEIVVHPCDGMPSYSPALDDWSLANVSLPQLSDDMDDTTFTPVLVTPDTTCTSSVPETPMPSTPVLTSSPKFGCFSPTECLQVPISTSGVQREEEQPIVVNMSNLSGKKFVLNTPPGKGSFGLVQRRGRALSVNGLGFGGDVISQANENDSRLDNISEDVEDDLGDVGLRSTFSSDSDLDDLAAVLEEISSESDIASGHAIDAICRASGSTMTVNTRHASDRYSFLRLAGLSSHLSIDLTDIRISPSGSLDEPDDGEVAGNRSGSSEYQDCSADLSFGLSRLALDEDENVLPMADACRV